jgi:hypothetical protein
METAGAGCLAHRRLFAEKHGEVCCSGGVSASWRHGAPDAGVKSLAPPAFTWHRPRWAALHRQYSTFRLARQHAERPPAPGLWLAAVATQRYGRPPSGGWHDGCILARHRRLPFLAMRPKGSYRTLQVAMNWLDSRSTEQVNQPAVLICMYPHDPKTSVAPTARKYGGQAVEREPHHSALPASPRR